MTQAPNRPAPTRPSAASAEGIDSDTLRWAVELVHLVRNPVFPGAVFAALLMLAGVVILGVSGWGASHQMYVALQLPFVVSGGFGALGLIVAGALLGSVLGNRRDEAMADQELGAVLAEVTSLAREGLPARPAGRSGRD